jgi:hypothetical protein
MTRGNVLAALLYRKAVELKNQNYSKLYWKKSRNNLIKSLSAMQFLTHCIGMECIQDDQAEIIISTLKNSFFFDTDELRSLLNEASAESNITKEYRDLLFHMNLVLSSCIYEVSGAKSECTESVRKYICGFHNMPRAFLSISDKMKISPTDAWNYSKPYLKFD